MARRNNDPAFDDEEIANEDPMGERMFAEGGFEDAPDGGPAFDAPGMDDPSVNRRPAQGGQKMAGIPESRQQEVNTPSADRPDSSGVVIRERGGEAKGDPAVGGTRTE